MAEAKIEEKVYPTSPDDYDVFEEIGKGAFATVYRGTVKKTGDEVAIKVLDLEKFNTNWDEIRKEITIMRQLNHPNVVRIYTSFVDQQDLWIVMPLLDGGSCAAIMKTLAPTGFKDETLLATILKLVLEGLAYFHKDAKIHRDLKAGNILISGSGEVQLADFGVAGTLLEGGDRKETRATFTGTPCWMAPEVMEQTNGYDTKADIWSFGITAMELAFGYAPYARFQPMKVLLLTLQEAPPTIKTYKDPNTKLSKNFEDLIAKCLNKTPSKRQTARELLKHPFFKKAEDQKYIVKELLSKLPPPKKSTKPIVLKRSQHTKTEATDPGSWVFDTADLKKWKAEGDKKGDTDYKLDEDGGGTRFEVTEDSSGEQKSRFEVTDLPATPGTRFEVVDEEGETTTKGRFEVTEESTEEVTSNIGRFAVTDS